MSVNLPKSGVTKRNQSQKDLLQANDLRSTLVEQQDAQSLTEKLLGDDNYENHQKNQIQNGSPNGNTELKIQDYEQILDRVGGFGKFQVIGVAMSVISFITEGCLIYPFSFLTLMPDYLCNDDGAFSPYHCQKTQTCNYPNQDMLSLDEIQNTQGFTINWNNQTSLFNLVEELNLRSAENWQIGFIGSCYFMGAVFGNSFLSRLGDTIGRISMIRAGISVSMIIYIFFLFLSTSIVINYILMFLFGSLTSLRVSVSYLYGQEIVKSKHSNMIGSLFNIFDSLTIQNLISHWLNCIFYQKCY